MTYLLFFLSWTLLLYVMHRLAHIVPLFSRFHSDHHLQVSNNSIVGFSWTNLFLFFDSVNSTVDQWITEVIPTILFSILTNQYWLLIFYYVWAALIQESIEHNERINLYPILTSGKWHLLHHTNANKNYGVFTPIWDILFGSRIKYGNSE